MGLQVRSRRGYVSLIPRGSSGVCVTSQPLPCLEEQELEFYTLRALSYWLRAAQGQVGPQALWAFHAGGQSDFRHLRASSKQSHSYKLLQAESH